MDTQKYIQLLKTEDIPWHRLTTAYGRATDFPKYFKTMWEMKNMEEVKNAYSEIISNIEHQGTLWHSTAFSVIFLVRIFEHALNNMEENEIACYLAEELLDSFEVIAVCCNDAVEMGFDEDEVLPEFSDMIKEEYLYPEEYNEEEEELCWEEDSFEDLLASFYYYSYEALLPCKKMLEKLKNTDLEESADSLLELLSSNPFQNE